MGGTKSATGALTPDDFAGALPHPDKRRETRIPHARMIDILPVVASGRWSFRAVELRDCSLSGLGFVAAEPMRIGEQFLAKLRLRRRVTMLIYTVAHCRPIDGGGGFAVGAQFSGYIASPFQGDPHEILTAMLEAEGAAQDDG